MYIDIFSEKKSIGDRRRVGKKWSIEFNIEAHTYYKLNPNIEDKRLAWLQGPTESLPATDSLKVVEIDSK